ncbi:hypothetical protein H0266_04700 [Halobacillus locisalis]|uniref:Uncharacterized protein n=1 Tax=Halobacillus locisalis TaxID=220753 RepID=A0A838CQU9_9BACI|nr:hypothetical protein [Halobacillus locisalis]MBA2174199.1 hypothetical protein [Halobacillus locisalis]
MNPLTKRFLLRGLIISVLIAVIIVGSVFIFVRLQLQAVKNNVLERHPSITSVEQVNTLGGWGESGMEYVLEVRKGTGSLYRIWSDEEGVITDEEVINHK